MWWKYLLVFVVFPACAAAAIFALSNWSLNKFLEDAEKRRQEPNPNKDNSRQKGGN